MPPFKSRPENGLGLSFEEDEEMQEEHEDISNLIERLDNVIEQVTTT